MSADTLTAATPTLRLGSSPVARVIRVVKGELIVFFAHAEGTAAHHHLATLGEGDLLFDIGWQASDSKTRLFASSLPDTELEELSLSALTPAELETGLEQWIKALLGAILHLSEEESAFTHPTVPGEEVPALEKGEVIGIRRGVGWWQPRGGNICYLETRPIEGLWLPLIPRLGVEIAEAMPSSPLLTTAQFLIRMDWLEALAKTQATLALAIRQALEHIETEQLYLARQRATLSSTALNQGWQELVEVMSTTPPATPAAPETRAVEIAFLRVARYLGIELKPLSQPLKATTAIDKVGELARYNSIRWRQVVLQDRWYERDHGPLVALMATTGDVVTLLPHGARRYRVVDAAGRTAPVTEELAQQMDPQAVMLYRTLPAEKLKLRNLVRFALKGSYRDLSLVLMMVLITGLLGLATPALSARIYDVIIPQSEHGLMGQILLILGVAALTQSLFELVRSMTLMRVENRANSELQAAVWDRLLRLPSRFFRRFTSGDLAGRVQGVTDAHQILASTGVSILFILPTGLFNLVVMFWHNRTLALWGLGIALLGALFSVAFNLAEVLILRKQYEIHGKLSGMVVQIINGVGKLRMANAEAFAFNTWARQYGAQERLSMRAGRWSVLSQTFFSGFPVLVTAMIFGLIGWQVAHPSGAQGMMSTGAFLAFNAAFGALISSLVSVAQQSLGLLQLFPLLERTRPIFEEEPEVAVTRVHPGQLQGEIEINNLTFSYRSDTPPVLDRVSLKVRPGEMVAIVGPSGCGKSTLLRLLLGFETPESGTIFYDGKDLQTLDLQELRRQIGVVLQNTQLFAGDIFRNIVGESNLTLEEAWVAAEMAGLADDIRKMPMQMHTVVSEGGSSFSGGQKQRLAIARAFAHQPRLLFFDEATSALDNRTQAMVTESMERLQVTRIVVAHRLSTIIRAQRIVVLQQGQIVEEGTFDALMAKRGVFYELARHQMA